MSGFEYARPLVARYLDGLLQHLPRPELSCRRGVRGRGHEMPPPADGRRGQSCRDALAVRFRVPTTQTTLTPGDAVPLVAELKTVWVSALNFGPNMYVSPE